jgi:putative PIN family toxin of toxin-antitoxin system
MHVMIDTNILISLMLSPDGQVSAVMKALVRRHTLCVPSFCLLEMETVVRRKWPHKLAQIDAFLQSLPYEIVRTPDVLPETPYIRDVCDSPVLATAMLSEADVLLTGDKDFRDVELTKPRIMTPAQFAAMHL